MLADIFAQLMQKKGDDGDVGPSTTAKMAAQGRDGDSLIAHINPREAAILKAIGGRGSVNPKTGALEFAFDGDGAMGGSGGWSYGDPGSYSESDLGNLNAGLDAAGFGPSNNFGNNGNGTYGNSGQMFSSQGYDITPQTPFGGFDPNAANQAATDFNNRFAPGGDLEGLLGNGGSTSGFDWSGGTGAPSVDQYLDPNALPAGTGAELAGPSPSAAGSPAPGGTPGAGAINPEASIGYNPLSSWQASFGALGGTEPALTRLDSGEVVYGNDIPSLGNLRGMRDNTNFQVDGFQRAPGDDLSVANIGAGGLGDVGDGQRPENGPIGWSGVGPAGFGLPGGASRGQAAGAVQGLPGIDAGSNPTDAYGARVPTITPNYRDTSSFSTPMADAITRMYDQNPNLPQGYLEGMYGKESSYGANMHRPGSAFMGPYQFNASTMASAAPQLAPVSRSTLYDPYANMQALNGEFGNMVQTLGRNPTAEEAYAMHQQGVRGGAMAISNPYTPMTDLGRPVRSLTANGLPADATYRDFIQKFGTPVFGFTSDYSPDGSVQGPVGLGSMFR